VDTCEDGGEAKDLEGVFGGHWAMVQSAQLNLQYGVWCGLTCCRTRDMDASRNLSILLSSN
jgi:hypothetical protein